MKITNIKKENDVFLVTFTPNFIERIIGLKEQTKRYKHTGGFYEYNMEKCVINENGEMMKATDKIVQALSNFERRF